MGFSTIGRDTYQFGMLNLDTRWYHGIHADQVLAVQGYFYGTYEDAPFWRLASLGGGAIGRAYSQDRWLDDVVVSVQAEWRWRALKHFGLVAFGGAGVVDESVAKLRAKYLRPSVGLGIRYFSRLGEEVVPLRFDLAFGYRNWRMTLAVDEAF
jgi:hemolysin activation/secretion protein